jgi:hypothetical protein
MRFSLQADVQTSRTAHGKMYVVKLPNIKGKKKEKYLLQNINELQKQRKKTILDSCIQAHIY